MGEAFTTSRYFGFRKSDPNIKGSYLYYCGFDRKGNPQFRSGGYRLWEDVLDSLDGIVRKNPFLLDCQVIYVQVSGVESTKHMRIQVED